MQRRTRSRISRHMLLLVVTMAALQPAVSSAESPGKQILQQRCALCHAAPDPKSLTSEEWVVTLKSMAPNAGLDSEETANVLDFVSRHAKQAEVIVSMAKERKLFEDKCSECHTTARVFLEPLTSESRRHIVMRMQQYAPNRISVHDAHEILEFLNHGAPEARRPPPREPITDGGPAATFRERCTACHTAERVFLLLKEGKNNGTAPPWLHIVNRMQNKAPDWISKAEARDILEYLQTLQ